jgi:hypothetical protein
MKGYNAYPATGIVNVKAPYGKETDILGQVQRTRFIQKATEK